MEIRNETAEFLRERFGKQINTALILGTGLNPVADLLDLSHSCSYAEIPHAPVPTVCGHEGFLYLGRIGEASVAVFQGRLHHYEGWSLEEVGFPVRVARALGAQTLIVTNAAGGIHRSLEPGAFMLIRDHINLMAGNPLVGSPPSGGFQPFTDMTHAYSRSLRALGRQVFCDAGIRCFEGVLAAVTGPCYETPAEIRMMEIMGADAVCMSTVPEVILARAMQMKVLGISLITNRAAGQDGTLLDHEDVIRIGKKGSAGLSRLLISLMKGLHRGRQGDNRSLSKRLASGEADC